MANRSVSTADMEPKSKKKKNCLHFSWSINWSTYHIHVFVQIKSKENGQTYTHVFWDFDRFGPMRILYDEIPFDMKFIFSSESVMFRRKGCLHLTILLWTGEFILTFVIRVFVVRVWNLTIMQYLVYAHREIYRNFLLVLNTWICDNANE